MCTLICSQRALWCIFAQTYREALDTMKKESGILEASILDLRGNHDAFNMAERLFFTPSGVLVAVAFCAYFSTHRLPCTC